MEQHVIARDGFIPEQYIDQALASLPPVESLHWSNDEHGLSGSALFYPLFEEHETVKYLDAVIMNTVSNYYKNPTPDHTFTGVVQLLPGMSIPPHREATNIREGLRRRLGLYIFLNDPDGGAFELWDELGPTRRVDAYRGRIVMYDVNCYHAITRVENDSRLLALTIHLASSTLPEEPKGRSNPEVFEPVGITGYGSKEGLKLRE